MNKGTKEAESMEVKAQKSYGDCHQTFEEAILGKRD